MFEEIIEKPIDCIVEKLLRNNEGAKNESCDVSTLRALLMIEHSGNEISLNETCDTVSRSVFIKKRNPSTIRELSDNSFESENPMSMESPSIIKDLKAEGHGFSSIMDHSDLGLDQSNMIENIKTNDAKSVPVTRRPWDATLRIFMIISSIFVFLYCFFQIFEEAPYSRYNYPIKSDD
jgi:hypothetical protein